MLLLENEYNLKLNPSTNIPIHRSTDSPIHRSTDPPIHRFTDPPIYRSTDSPIHRFTDSPIYRFTDSPIHQSTQSTDDAIGINVHSFGGRNRRKSWHAHHITQNWNDESGSNGKFKFPHCNCKSFWTTYFPFIITK
jgi:hypothetical protein